MREVFGLQIAEVLQMQEKHVTHGPKLNKARRRSFKLQVSLLQRGKATLKRGTNL